MGDCGVACEIVVRQGWLSRTPPTFQQDVLSRSRLEVYKARATIYMVGDPAGGVFGLVSGRLGISIAPGGRCPCVEVAAITGQPRRVGLVAMRDATLLHLPLRAVREIVEQDPAAWGLFALITIGHLDVAIGASGDLMIRDHRKRFIALLLRLGGSRLASPADDKPAEIDVRQEALAVMANVARTTAGALLRSFEAAGYLELLYCRIRILAPNEMRAMLVE